MKLNDIAADEKHGNGLLGLLIFLLVVGVTVGSVYLAKNSGDMAEGIKNYIGSFCTAVSENKNSMTVFKNSLQANLISVGIVFLMGCCILAAYCTNKRKNIEKKEYPMLLKGYPEHCKGRL